MGVEPGGRGGAGGWLVGWEEKDVIKSFVREGGKLAL